MLVLQFPRIAETLPQNFWSRRYSIALKRRKSHSQRHSAIRGSVFFWTDCRYMYIIYVWPNYVSISGNSDIPRDRCLGLSQWERSQPWHDSLVMPCILLHCTRYCPSTVFACCIAALVAYLKYNQSCVPGHPAGIVDSGPRAQPSGLNQRYCHGEHDRFYATWDNSDATRLHVYLNFRHGTWLSLCNAQSALPKGGQYHEAILPYYGGMLLLVR